MPYGKKRINFDYRLSANHSLNLNTLINYARRQPNDDIANQHAGFVIGGFPSKKTSVVPGLTWEAKLFGRKLTNMFSAKYFHLHSEIEDLTSYEMIEARKKKSNTTSQIGWIEAMKYEPFRGFHLKAFYQRAIRLPNSQELFGDGIITFPAAELKPEKSHNFNLGFLIDKNDVLGMSRLQFEVNGFYMRVGDMIKLIKQHMAAGYVNAEKVRIKGFETELKADVTPSIYAYANCTYQDVRDALDYLPKSTTPNPTKGMRVPNIPYLFANFGAEVAIINLKTNQVEKVIKDERVGFVGLFRHTIAFSDELGDMYFYSLGMEGNKPLKDGFVRIKNGTDEWDRDYYFQLSKTPATGIDKPHGWILYYYYAGDGIVYACINIPSLTLHDDPAQSSILDFNYEGSAPKTLKNDFTGLQLVENQQVFLRKIRHPTSSFLTIQIQRG